MNTNHERFATVLRDLVDAQPFSMSPGLLAKLSGTPKGTIVNWLDGRVRRPRRWQDVARVAAALRVGVVDADRLLVAAGHVRLERLIRDTSPRDRNLLEPWRLQIPIPQRRTPTSSGMFFGRLDDVEKLLALVVGPVPGVVNVTGPPGVGKTRLATEVIHRLGPSPFERVVHVPFDDVSRPIDATRRIAHALSVDGTIDAADSAQWRQLADTSTLIFLDGIDRIIDTLFPILKSLSSIGTNIRVLTTSRSLLQMSSEQTYRVRPLTVPDVSAGGDLKQLGDDAVSLFIDRARITRPDLDTSTDSLTAVIEICRRLDGLPLAIEIAADHMALIPPTALLARLEQGRALKTWRRRDCEERHRSIRAAIGWTYEQLHSSHQDLLAMLAMFPGGVALDLLERATTTTEHGDTLDDDLTSLVDSSFVRADPIGSGRLRFSLLGVIRTFVLATATDNGAPTHDCTVLSLYLEALAELRSAPSTTRHRWRARLREEVDNIQALSVCNCPNTSQQSQHHALLDVLLDDQETRPAR